MSDHVEILKEVLEVNEKICTTTIEGLKNQIDDDSSPLFQEYLDWATHKLDLMRDLGNQALEVARKLDAVCAGAMDGSLNQRVASNRMDILAKTVGAIDEKFHDMELFAPFRVISKIMHDRLEHLSEEQSEQPGYIQLKVLERPTRFDN